MGAKEWTKAKQYGYSRIVGSHQRLSDGRRGQRWKSIRHPTKLTTIEIITNEGITKGLIEAVLPEQIEVVTDVRFSSIHIEDDGSSAAILFSDNTQVKVKAEELYTKKIYTRCKV